MRNTLLIILLLLIHFFFLINLQFTAWPEMMSFPYLLNNGFNLYQDMVHPYPPLLTLILSRIYLLFGYSVVVLKVITWIAILVNDILIVKIVKLVTKSDVASIFALTLYVVAQPVLEGNMMWPDLAFVPFVLGAVYTSFKGLSFKARKNPDIGLIMLSGFLFTLAALTKQTAALFGIVGFVYVVWQSRNVKSILTFIFAPVFMGIVFLSKLYAIGDLAHFLNWTLIYPSQLWTRFPGYVDMAVSNHELLIIASLFVPMLLSFNILRLKNLNINTLFLISMFFVSVITVYPRFSFFHFQSSLAFIAILTGIVVVNSNRIKLAFLGVVFVMAYTLFPIYRVNWGKPVRFASAEDMKLSELIQENIPDTDTVYLLGPNSINYVFSNRLPAKPWIDNFGWYFQYVGPETMYHWRQNYPDYIVWTKPETGEWYELGTYQPSAITPWIRINYERVRELQPDIWLWKYRGM